MTNRSRYPTVCGRLAIAQERPNLPADGGRLPDRPRVVVRVTVADVSCPG